MSAGGPTKPCPRCNTVLPMQAAFCGTCGYQFNLGPGPAPSGGNDGPPQYAGQNAPGGWAQSQPAYPPQSQPAYPPQAQPGYPPQGQPGFPPPGQPGFGYPPAPAQKKGGGGGKVIAILLVLVVVVGGGGAAAWFLYLNPARCSGPLFSRHSLPDNIPLPSGCAFDSHPATQTLDESGASLTAEGWSWTVNGSDPTAVQKFYQDNLGSSGWSKITPVNDDEKQQKDVTACQGQQALIIGAGSKLEISDANGENTRTLNAPAGGSALGIELFTATNSQGQLVLTALCSGTTPPGVTP